MFFQPKTADASRRNQLKEIVYYLEAFKGKISFSEIYYQIPIRDLQTLYEVEIERIEEFNRAREKALREQEEREKNAALRGPR